MPRVPEPVAEADYLALLRKARANLPENVHNKERWTLPRPDIQPEGRMTLLRNFKEMLASTRRDQDHMAKFLLSQIGTAGHVDGDRLVFTGKVPPAKIQGVLDDYVETYVRCSECGAPDTHLEKDARVSILRCEACGAHTPIKARKARRPEAAVKESGVYQLALTQPGQRGEAKGLYEGYVFVVPGGQVGQTVWARVTKLSGKMAFSELTTQPKE
jgi:translation initiation factor 2 subunit 2